MMDIRMEVHKIVLASISFNNLSKESFLSFTFNKCLYFSLKRSAGKCQIKSDKILVFPSLPASQVIRVFEDIGRRPDQRADQSSVFISPCCQMGHFFAWLEG